MNNSPNKEKRNTSHATKLPKAKGHKPFVPVSAIEVDIWGQKVGVVALDERLGFYVFAYEPSFIHAGIELAPLKMSISLAKDPFVFTDIPADTYKRLPAMLADSLPDDFGNALIDSYMAEHGIGKDAITSLDRLAYMGSRSMGALEFRPVRGPKTNVATAIDLSELVSEARNAVQGMLGTNATDTLRSLRNIIEVGTSAGGARAKAVIAWNEATGEMKSGQGLVDAGFEHWLLKFDGLGTDRELGLSKAYGRIEFAYYLMAKYAGISMSRCHLLEENGRAHFMTKRFDRRGNERIHMQSLCAMDHLDFKKRGTNSYEQLFIVMRELNLGMPEFEEAFARMVFNALAMNCDDHTKNFAFLLRKGEGWTLAPAYDVTFAYNPKGEWTKEHLMSINGKWLNFSRSDFLRIADRFAIGRAEEVIDRVIYSLDIWAEAAAEAGVGEAERKKIAVLLKANIKLAKR